MEDIYFRKVLRLASLEPIVGSLSFREGVIGGPTTFFTTDKTLLNRAT